MFGLRSKPSGLLQMFTPAMRCHPPRSRAPLALAQPPLATHPALTSIRSTHTAVTGRPKMLPAALGASSARGLVAVAGEG